MEIATAEQIKEIYNENREIIEVLENENEDLLKKYFFLVYGVKIGSVVKVVKRSGTEKLYRVARFGWKYNVFDRPTVFGNLQKVNGTYSEGQHDLWSNWEVVKL